MFPGVPGGPWSYENPGFWHIVFCFSLLFFGVLGLMRLLFLVCFGLGVVDLRVLEFVCFGVWVFGCVGLGVVICVCV